MIHVSYLNVNSSEATSQESPNSILRVYTVQTICKESWPFVRTSPTPRPQPRCAWLVQILFFFISSSEGTFKRSFDHATPLLQSHVWFTAAWRIKSKFLSPSEGPPGAHQPAFNYAPK